MAVPEEAYRWINFSFVWDVNRRKESFYIKFMGSNCSITNIKAVFLAEWHPCMT